MQGGTRDCGIENSLLQTRDQTTHTSTHTCTHTHTMAIGPCICGVAIYCAVTGLNVHWFEGGRYCILSTSEYDDTKNIYIGKIIP